MEITHEYEGMGRLYTEARKGTPAFAEFMIKNLGLEQAVSSDRPLLLVEFGAGSGQQTKLVEDELKKRGIGYYTLLALDKSYGLSPKGEPRQLDVLKDRIEAGEITTRVIPFPYDVDRELPFPSNSTDLAYFAFVIHHLKNRPGFFNEVSRISRNGSRFFSFDAALEDLVGHPLDEFFPEKFEYDSRRYPTREQIKSLFENAGFEYQQRQLILRDSEKPVDDRFLESVMNKTINSVLVMIEKENPIAYQEGVERVMKAVEEGRARGHYRIFSIKRAIDWGIKR